MGLEIAIVLVVSALLFIGLFVGWVTAFNKSRTAMDTASQLARWRKLYRREFGIELGEVIIPKRWLDFDWLIVIAAGLTIGQVLAALKSRFSVYSYYDDLDAEVVENERGNATTRAIWCRNRTEADEENANKSARDTKAAGLATQTLLEHLLHVLMVFDEDGTHLDVDNISLCAGSRGSGGNVPRVYWNAADRKLYVGWCCPGRSDGYLRARAVVSLPAEASAQAG